MQIQFPQHGVRVSLPVLPHRPQRGFSPDAPDPDLEEGFLLMLLPVLVPVPERPFNLNSEVALRTERGSPDPQRLEQAGPVQKFPAV